MKTIRALTAMAAWIAAAGAVAAQDVAVPKDVMDRLRQQAPAEQRRLTVVPGAAAVTPPAADADKLRSVQDLLDQVERKRGAQSGTLKALSDKGATVSLQHDLTKVRQNFSAFADAPFSGAISGLAPDPAITVATSPAAVEFRSRRGRDAVEKIVSIKSKAAVAANALASGERPVSLRIANANLTASQIPSPSSELAVNVKVGGETRKLNVGDVSRFENFEVTVLASANHSARRGFEGLPYVLRLQVMPLH